MISPVLHVYKRNILNPFAALHQQSAQAHRKPLWLPMAKSKLFRIPKRPEISDEEKIELKRVNDNYKTQMRAIRQFYYGEIQREKSSRESTTSEENKRLEAEDWQRCLALNDEWNAAISVEREKRRQAEFEKMEKYMLTRMEQEDLKLEKTIEEASAKIKLQKELCSTFITPETLDAAIDQALANPVDYNFAIDMKGQRYHGRETPIQIKKEKPSNITSET